MGPGMTALAGHRYYIYFALLDIFINQFYVSCSSSGSDCGPDCGSDSAMILIMVLFLFFILEGMYKEYETL